MQTPDSPVAGAGVRAGRTGWKRVWKGLLWGVGSLACLVLVGALVIAWLWNSGRLMNWMMVRGAVDTEQIAPSERPWPPSGTPAGTEPPDLWPGPRESLVGIGTASGFYRATNVWEVELQFSAREWEALQPIPNRPSIPLGQAPDRFPLRNPEAPRNGLAGVVGMGQPWSSGRVTVGGQFHSNVAIRLKGNGTFIGSLGTYKKPYKLDFGRGAAGRRLAGFEVLNLNNLNGDFSGVSDAMAYGFYRKAGVPAPRTAFARLLLGIEGRFHRRPLGLYVLVESADEHWARDVFPGRRISLFKPVTYELFSDLGTNWSDYEGIYDPKTPLTEAQQQRVMETARFVTSATDDEFAARAGEHFDLPEVARFIAVTSLLSSYDGFLSNGQNFVMYLDQDDGRFGLVPWDLDRAWGEFPLMGTRVERETASLRHPWVADHRLMERLFAVPAFAEIHGRELRRIHRELFDVARLREQARCLASIIRPTVLEESDYRIDRFDRSHGEEWPETEPEPNISDPFRPVHRIHRFLVKRGESVEAQLEGREVGHVFHRRMQIPNSGRGEAGQ